MLFSCQSKSPCCHILHSVHGAGDYHDLVSTHAHASWEIGHGLSYFMEYNHGGSDNNTNSDTGACPTKEEDR